MRLSRRGLLAAASGLAVATRADATANPDMRTVGDAMRHRRFVSYQPTAIRALNGKLSHADDESIAADLKALRPWFDGLLTYSSANGAERVPDIATRLGFKAVVLGVFDIRDAVEYRNALAAIRRNGRIIVGCGVGNETVLSKSGSWRDVARAVAQMRDDSHIPVSTTEPFAEYLDQKESAVAVSEADFLMVNIHPIFESWFRSGTSANWTQFVSTVCDRLAAAYRKPILVKETGVPSGPASAGYSEAMQRDFWRALAQRMPASRSRAFSYFTAFDSPWRAFDATPVSGPRPEEAHWGLFTELRAPKAVVADLPRLP